MAGTVADDGKLASLWDATQNAEPAAKVAATSFRPAHWKCSQGHSFSRSPRSMQRDASCPACSKSGSTHTNLLKLRPTLAALWDAEKNTSLALADIDATRASPVWWRCPNGHSFQRPPVRMLADDACPTCALAKTSLTAVAPNVAAEWHPTKNAITPTEVDADHVMNAWWICPNGHEYQATVRSRAREQPRAARPATAVGRSRTSARSSSRSSATSTRSTRASCSRWRCRPAFSRTRAEAVRDGALQRALPRRGAGEVRRRQAVAGRRVRSEQAAHS